MKSKKTKTAWLLLEPAEQKTSKQSTKKVSQVVSLNYRNTSAKINIAILIAIIFTKSIVIQ